MVYTSYFLKFLNGVNPYFLIGLYLTFLKFVFEVYLYVFGGPYLPFLKITSGGMLPLNFTLSFWWSVPLFQVPLLLCFVLFFCWVYSNSFSRFCQYFFIIYFISLNIQNLFPATHTFRTYSKELSSHFPLALLFLPPPTTQKGSAGRTGTDSLMLVLLAQLCVTSGCPSPSCLHSLSSE